MTLIEDIKNGKYNLVLILILFVLSFHQYWSKSVAEHMADTNMSEDVKEAVKQVYNADIESIRKLSDFATKIQVQPNGLTIPGNLKITGSVTVGSKDVDSQIELINKKGGRGMLLHPNIYDQGGSIYLYSPENLNGQYNYKNHIHYDSSTISATTVTSDIKEAVRQVYNADVEAIRNLSEVANKLQAGGLTIPGNLTVTGSINTNGTISSKQSITVGSKDGADGGIVLVNKQGGHGLFLSSNYGNQGGSIYFYAPANPENQYNNKNHIHYNSSTLITPGMIVSWTGTTPPEGWALCDGTKGTPDLRGRFVLGLGQTASMDNSYTGFGSKSYERSYNFIINETGGENKHTLNENEMPAHNHKSRLLTWGGGDAQAPTGGDWGWNLNWADTQNKGGNESHNNMPPYYVLAYIMKI